MCDVCQDIHYQIRCYQQCQEEGRPFTLSKGDVKANIKFPLSWNQKQCLCCFKDTKNYESYNNIIQMVMVTAIRLLQNFNDEEKILQGNACTTEMESQNDIDAGDAIWSIAELEHLLVFISNSMVMSFPLYILCKHNRICGIEELSNQETTILASYCEVDVSDAESLSVMLLRNVCFFCDSGGPQAIKKCFEEYSQRLSIPLLGHIVHCLANLKHWLTMGAIDTYIFPLKPSIVRYICAMSDDELRQAGSRGITEVVMAVIKEPNPVKALFDKEYLKLSFKYFSCSTLKIRMAGLQQLNSQVALFNEALSVQEGEQLLAAGLLLAEWLVTNRIIEHIFGPNIHNELVKQSQIVLNFLANEGKITVEHIDIMWAAAMQKHCSRQVQDVLILLVKHLTSSPLVHLMDLLAALEPQCHTEQTLLLLSSITKRFWLIQSQEEKNVSKCPNTEFLDTSLENEISICSTDEESEESSESDGDVQQLPARPKRSIQLDVLNAVTTDENPVQIVYSLPDRSSDKRSPSEGSQQDCSSPTTSGQQTLGESKQSTDTATSSNEEQMNVSSDNEGASMIMHATLPVTIEDLERITSAGGTAKRVRSPASSPNISVKSDKNMADFEGEDYNASDEELERIDNEVHKKKPAKRPLQIGPHSPTSPPSPPSPPLNHKWIRSRSAQFQEELNISLADQITAAAKYLDVVHITEPGHTILWDLVQEDVAPLLAEGLAHEAEKLLSVLLCVFDMSVTIKLEFIHACINNIENNKTSTVSLRLLPKLISSFQQSYRVAREVHTTTMYIEESFSMMTVVFGNLTHFREKLNTGDYQTSSIYGLKTDITVRLQFLSFIYSYVASPEQFRMNREQVDIVWDCLAMYRDTSDHALSWFYNQANSRELHALSIDTFKYIYNEKLSQLSRKDMTMTGFNLFHLLHEMLSQTELGDDKGHDTQLWDIALRSQCTEVSLSAIDYLNSCYMSDHDLSREPEFVERCMRCLMTTLKTFNTDCETSMQVIDRGLYLLRNHLESFRQKYAYQLRSWQLRGGGVMCHQPQTEEKGTQVLKIYLSASVLKNIRAPTNSYKVEVDVSSSVLLGELRADVTHWWNTLVKQQKQQDVTSSGAVRSDGSSSSAGKLSDTVPVPVRLICGGQELSMDLDRKPLQQVPIKNEQTVLVSVSSNRQKLKQEAAVQLHQLSQLIPMLILVQQPHFDNLFNMLEELSNAQKTLPRRINNRHIMCSRARVLSRRVWELLMIVPTNPSILQSISRLSSERDDSLLDCGQLLDSSQPSKLIYSLQIIESLSMGEKRHKPSLTILAENEQVVMRSEDVDQGKKDKEIAWTRKFITQGGLSHLFDILASRKLEVKEGQPWNDWDQDAFAYLLKQLCQFAVVELDSSTEGPSTSSTSPSSASGAHSLFSSIPSTHNQSKRQQSQRTVIPRLNKVMLKMIDARFEVIFNIIHSVIHDSVLPCNNPTPIWGRFEALHQAMIFLVHWAYSDEKVLHALHNSTKPSFYAWLKRLTLEAPESQLRQEACKSLYKLCLSQQMASDGHSDGHSTSPYAVLTLSTLLELLPMAASMQPLMNEASEPADNRKCKLGPSSQDCLWLAGQLLDSMDESSIRQFDLDTLADSLRKAIASRRFYEERHSAAEDEGLIGLLNMLSYVIKHNDSYKQSDAAKELLSEIFDDLFLLPCIKSRHLPKCKSNTSRCSAYDLLVELAKGSADNYRFLHSKLVEQHDRMSSYPWDYWPMEDVRSVSGYVGLQNLGATCYMATCMQHLYMIPQARQSILKANIDEVNPLYAETLKEMKKMFAYLMESERKSYNPQNFCKVYEMDRQPLNTGEQKDMTEFFTDLITKLEEISPDLKSLVKDLFGGVTSNNVVSLDCPHVSRTLEEFYTIRCQVADMRNLYESLDEVCVKDTLDGDNMYTCSRCQKKVRAEKRACFKRLPQVLCFNTMRYTFNMVTMLKEKINTHFSFPQQLSMADYMESNLLQPDKLSSRGDEDTADSSTSHEDSEDNESTDYELIGITVHTGTADGGHYYSFIRDRIAVEPGKPDKWFLFNDSEVKPFDPAQVAQECFGGEMTSTTYDTIADKFMDFSFEKTNSAYMLFYERVNKAESPGVQSTAASSPTELSQQPKFKFDMSEDLADWIWRDNTAFLQDKNIFCHNYFGFMWQMCAYIPTTLPKSDVSVRVLPAQLSSLFLLETFIHAKEKPTMVQWIELLTKQFNQCNEACEWLLDKMSTDDHWSKQILISCSNQMIRQMFQRLIIHVIKELRNRHYSVHKDLPAVPWLLPSDDTANRNVVARFICKQLQILQQADIQLSNCKYLSEYFSFLFEFGRLGGEEKKFLIQSDCISIMITFYVGDRGRAKSDSSQSGGSSEDDEDEALTALDEERFKVSSLEKMIPLVAMLVESSRDDRHLDLSTRDMQLLVGGKGMRYLVNQIKDCINPKETCKLIFSLSRWNEELATDIVCVILSNAVKSKSPLPSQTFLQVLTMTTELANSPPGHPQFTEIILSKFWTACERKPQQFLEWMSNLVCHNSVAHAFILDSLAHWVERYLLAHKLAKVRTWAMLLLVSLVPSQTFRNFARTVQNDKFSSVEQNVKAQMSVDALSIMHDIYSYLLDLMSAAKKYADISKYGTSQLVSYLSYLSLCLISRDEKLMFSPYFPHLWQMFQPKMTDPQVSKNQNKQALLLFWYHTCVDCPENVSLITSNPSVTKNIGFNYILADHDDQDVVTYNRCMLPAYYGILKACCQRSRSFTRHLAQHQNMMWAFQHILPYPNQYVMAVDELLAILQMIVTVHPDSPKEEEHAISVFKRKILLMYQQTLNSRSDWQTLITVLKIVLVTDEDRFIWVLMSGLAVLSEAFGFIHGMYHEATACHVLTDMSDCLSLIKSLLKVALAKLKEGNETVVMFDGTERTITLHNVISSWEKTFLIKNCLTLLNSYSPSEVRMHCLDVLKKLTYVAPEAVIGQIAPTLLAQHTSFQGMESPASHCCLEGPYFPTSSTTKRLHTSKINVRPPHPQFGMFLHHNIVETSKGKDGTYDHSLHEFYMPYHTFVDYMVRVAVNKSCLTDDLLNLSALVAYEGVPLHSPYFAKLWCEIYQAQMTGQSEKALVEQLCQSSYLIDYMESVLHDDRSSLSNQHIFQFFSYYFKLVHQMVLCDESTTEGVPLNTSMVQELHLLTRAGTIQSPSNALHSIIHRSHANMRALLLIYQVLPPTEYDPYVVATLTTLKSLCMEYKSRLNKQISEATAAHSASPSRVSAAMSPTDSQITSEDKSLLSLTVEDDQKVPELCSSSLTETKGSAPAKKRKLSPPESGDTNVTDPVPKLTIDYRPARTSCGAAKGQSRAASSDKGKAPAKKSQRSSRVVVTTYRSLDEESSDQTIQNLTANQSAASSESSNQSAHELRLSDSGSDIQGGSSSDTSTQNLDMTGNSKTCTTEAANKVKKKVEIVDNVLDTIGAVLSILENLEADEDMS